MTPDAPHSKDHPYPARLVENRLLNAEGAEKEMRHLSLELERSGLRYEAGDWLGVFPRNGPAEVGRVLGLLGCEPGDPVPVQGEATPIPFREALAAKLDLAHPTRALFEALGSTPPASDVQASAAHTADGEGGKASGPTVAEVLAESPKRRLEPRQFAACLRRLQPRLYSIASSPRLFPSQVHLTVAVVRYQSNGRPREGVCSTFLAQRPLGSTVPVFIARSRFKLPEDPARDVIMVGPGTGIAPFRAFLQERATAPASGRNWLFFGAQRRSTDFYYEQEMGALAASGTLHRLDTAFSRDQESKIYVQDRMRENASALWEWIDRGAFFYVCGDANRMARDVESTLLAIIAEQGRMPQERAAGFLAQMRKDGRYKRDVY